MNNTGKIPALAVRLIAALMTLYLYFNPTALAHAECRRPAYGGSRRRAERNPLVKKAAPF